MNITNTRQLFEIARAWGYRPFLRWDGHVCAEDIYGDLSAVDLHGCKSQGEAKMILFLTLGLPSSSATIRRRKYSAFHPSWLCMSDTPNSGHR